MLQSTEYQVGPYLKWLWRTKDYSTVMQRRTLDKTKRATMLLVALWFCIALEVLGGLLLIYLGVWHNLSGGVPLGLSLILAYPFVWSHLIVLPIVLGRNYIAIPAENELIRKSEAIFAHHPGIKIAIVGSYGKTSMKELLTTVLSEGKKVAETPANKNVSISHARFAQKLDGDEDILLIEYGEGAPGDVNRYAKYTHPTHAVITGLAPAHLDKYKTLHAAGEDIFSVADYLKGKHVYVNDESLSIKTFLKESYHSFNSNGALGWRVEDVEVALEGTNFTLIKGKKSLNLQSKLIGYHQVGFLAFVASLSLELGLKEEQVIAGIAKTQPFEHRMQPYQLNGAWIIDDTYNGNLEGIRAGTKLLKDLEAKRKIYVSPGLVDQGEETVRVHRKMGELIAGADPDLVVLMKNSVMPIIEEGLVKAKFKGKVKIESNPLEFYTNLTHFVAAGDLVVMQNDWTDNYV
jgi:UDP-N-acetylmuramoyl-tripeptide--D-alanyl-D-alanine ligase